MLSQKAIDLLSTLVRNEVAERSVSWLPFSGVYWSDELPSMQEMLSIPEEDHILIARLMDIRVQLARGEPISPELQDLWNGSQQAVPKWALFHRLELTPDDIRANDEIVESITMAMAAWLESADKAEVTTLDGVTAFSLTYDLTKDEAPAPPKVPGLKALWRRLTSR